MQDHLSHRWLSVSHINFCQFNCYRNQTTSLGRKESLYLSFANFLGRDSRGLVDRLCLLPYHVRRVASGRNFSIFLSNIHRDSKSKCSKPAKGRVFVGLSVLYTAKREGKVASKAMFALIMNYVGKFIDFPDSFLTCGHLNAPSLRCFRGWVNTTVARAILACPVLLNVVLPCSISHYIFTA